VFFGGRAAGPDVIERIGAPEQIARPRREVGERGTGEEGAFEERARTGGWGSIYRRGARRAGYRALAWARCMAVRAEAVWEGGVVYLDRVRGSGAGGDRGRAGWNVGWERTVGIRARSTQRGFVFVVSRGVDGVGIWAAFHGPAGWAHPAVVRNFVGWAKMCGPSY